MVSEDVKQYSCTQCGRYRYLLMGEEQLCRVCTVKEEANNAISVWKYIPADVRQQFVDRIHTEMQERIEYGPKAYGGYLFQGEPLPHLGDEIYDSLFYKLVAEIEREFLLANPDKIIAIRLAQLLGVADRCLEEIQADILLPGNVRIIDVTAEMSIEKGMQYTVLVSSGHTDYFYTRFRAMIAEHTEGGNVICQPVRRQDGKRV